MRTSLIALLALAACGGRRVEPLDAGQVDGGPPCVGLTVGPGSYDWSLAQGTLTRTFHVHVPASYDPRARTPVVLNFHGYSSSAGEQEGLSHMSVVSDEQGFISVYPNGIDAQDLGQTAFDPAARSWNGGNCCMEAVQYNVDDVGFVRKMLDQLAGTLCVDPARVFSTGLSNGGFLSHRLACELSDRIAAIAPVAGINGMPACRPPRGVPVLEFHGTADPVVPYAGNANWLSAPATVAAWAQRNGCTGPEQTSYRPPDAKCVTTLGCQPASATATLCSIDKGGHTWPGGSIPPLLGYTSPYVDASREMWQFFAAHPMR